MPYSSQPSQVLSVICSPQAKTLLFCVAAVAVVAVAVAVAVKCASYTLALLARMPGTVPGVF